MWLNENKKTHILEYVVSENFARSAFRTLLIAYRDLSVVEFETIKARSNGFSEEKDREELEKLGLTVIGIYGL